MLVARTALLLAALALATRGVAYGVDGPVTVTAEPTTLVLEMDARAALRIETGTDVAPTVTASIGRVENVRPVAAGRFAADYLPPREAYPQVAIVAALAGDHCGWTSIPLVGRGIAIAHSVPRSPIRVTIGEVAFGPVFADAHGEAHVSVVVPPGVRYAYHRGKPLDLKIPPTPHVHLLLARSVVPADAPHDVPLFVLAVTAEGSPQPAARVEVSVTEGTLDGLREIAPGTFAGTWRLPAGRAVDAIATGRIAGDPAPVSTASVSRPAGAPARIALEAATARVTAGDERPVALRIRVADAAGNAVAEIPTLEATVGTASPPVAAAPGRWEAALSVPAALGASRHAEVVARAGQAEDRIRISLAPGPAAQVALAPESATLVATGRAEARVRVRVLDRFGNDVPTGAPEVEATRGAARRSPTPAAGPSAIGPAGRASPRRRSSPCGPARSLPWPPSICSFRSGGSRSPRRSGSPRRARVSTPPPSGRS